MLSRRSPSLAYLAALASLSVLACGDEEKRTEPHAAAPPIVIEASAGAGQAHKTPDPITTDRLRAHVVALADDAMAGRAPGTEGGKKAVAYIKNAMKSLGLQPAGEDDTFEQRVSMRSVQTEPEPTKLALVSKGRTKTMLAFPDDIVATTYAEAGRHRIDAPLVFAGYGITAPEYGWDDYEGLDVEGKIVVVLVGDPPLGDDRFGGEAMTYYGRWTYKYERALEAKAAGCLVIHETEPASYGYNVVRNSWSGRRFHIVEPAGGLPEALSVQGWVARATAQKLAEAAGSTLDAWHEAALKPDFEPIETTVRLQGELVTTERRLEDANVLGRLRGAERADEAVFVTAHWDHLGTKTDTEGADDADIVYNGAVDNASGIAGMLAVAEALAARAAAGRPLKRSVVFLATTAEEQGLLGSRFYAAHPLMDVDDIVGVVNLDSMNVHGRTRSIQVVGLGQSTLEDTLTEVAAAQNRTIVPDARPQAGGYYRSDHFSFAKQGVPAIYFRGSDDMDDGGKEAGAALMAERAKRYHTVDDEYDPAWSFEGARQDAQAVLDLVVRVAEAAERPKWKPGSEFAEIRRAPTAPDDG